MRWWKVVLSRRDPTLATSPEFEAPEIEGPCYARDEMAGVMRWLSFPLSVSSESGAFSLKTPYKIGAGRFDRA